MILSKEFKEKINNVKYDVVEPNPNIELPEIQVPHPAEFRGMHFNIQAVSSEGINLDKEYPFKFNRIHSGLYSISTDAQHSTLRQLVDDTYFIHITKGKVRAGTISADNVQLRFKPKFMDLVTQYFVPESIRIRTGKGDFHPNEAIRFSGNERLQKGAVEMTLLGTYHTQMIEHNGVWIRNNKRVDSFQVFTNATPPFLEDERSEGLKKVQKRIDELVEALPKSTSLSWLNADNLADANEGDFHSIGNSRFLISPTHNDMFAVSFKGDKPEFDKIQHYGNYTAKLYHFETGNPINSVQDAATRVFMVAYDGRKLRAGFVKPDLFSYDLHPGFEEILEEYTEPLAVEIVTMKGVRSRKYEKGTVYQFLPEDRIFHKKGKQIIQQKMFFKLRDNYPSLNASLEEWEAKAVREVKVDIELPWTR